MTTQLNRRQLLGFVGIAVTAACSRQSDRIPELQQATGSTVTLVVDGMI
jgi:hypothetical protein